MAETVVRCAERAELRSKPRAARVFWKARLLKRPLLAGMAFAGLCFFTQTRTAQGQAPPHNYTEYPEPAGKTRQFHLRSLPPWVSFDAEVRGRLEGYTAYSQVPGQGQAYGLTRVRGGIRIEPTDFLSFHLQFQDTHAPGLPGKLAVNNTRDTFDLREGYAELKYKSTSTFAGRQELRFGSERLIGVSDFSNNSRTFDGVDLRIGGKNKVDIFSTSVVTIYPSSLDKHGGGLTYHGIYGQMNGIHPALSLQSFLLFKALPHIRSSRGKTGDELAITTGAAVQGNVKHIFEYDTLLALQRGSFAGDSIQSGAFYVKVFYSAPHLRLAPRIGGEYDYASGNSASDHGTVGTFDQQYPSNHNAFGLSDLFAFQNIRMARINLDLTLAKNFTALVQGESLNLASVHDSLYSSPGTVLVAAPAGGFATDSIGYGTDVSVKYVYHDALVWNAGFAYLGGGNLRPLSGKTNNLTYGYLSVTFRFGLRR